MKKCIRCGEPMDTLLRAYKTTYTNCFDCEIEVREGYSMRDITYTVPNHKRNWVSPKFKELIMK